MEKESYLERAPLRRNWHGAWLRFLEANKENKSYHYNYFLKGVWECFSLIKEELRESVLKTLEEILVYVFECEGGEIGGELKEKGFAGGVKMVRDNLFCKVAKDRSGLYGGDLFAGKAAKHELKSLNELGKLIVGERRVEEGRVKNVEGRVEGVLIPLYVLVDFLGVRVIASSLLPINESTLRYGSNDGGKRVVKEGEEVVKKAEEIGRALNLKEHYVGWKEEEKKLLFFSDTELHVGVDGRMYIVDCARLMPPNPPEKKRKGSVFYKLFRAEFVRKYGVPVSSDSFTRWGFFDSLQNNSQVRSMYTHYLFSFLPSLSSFLLSSLPSPPSPFSLCCEFHHKDNLKRSENRVGDELKEGPHMETHHNAASRMNDNMKGRDNESGVYDVKGESNARRMSGRVLRDMEKMVQELQKEGANLRDMGRVRSGLDCLYLRKLLLLECLARSMRFQVRKILNDFLEKMKKEKREEREKVEKGGEEEGRKVEKEEGRKVEKEEGRKVEKEERGRREEFMREVKSVLEQLFFTSKRGHIERWKELGEVVEWKFCSLFSLQEKSFFDLASNQISNYDLRNNLSNSPKWSGECRSPLSQLLSSSTFLEGEEVLWKSVLLRRVCKLSNLFFVSVKGEEKEAVLEKVDLERISLSEEEHFSCFVCKAEASVKFASFLQETRELFKGKGESPILKRTETIGRNSEFAKQKFKEGFTWVLEGWGKDEKLEKKLEEFLQNNDLMFWKETI